MTALKLFGTDGIRGRAGAFPLDSSTLRKLARALAETYPGPVVIGRDTRVSGEAIEELLARELGRAGLGVVPVGIMTTPGVSYLTAQLEGGFGVAVSASHNPFHDNGIKLFQQSGEKFLSEQERTLEESIGTERPVDGKPDCSETGEIQLRTDEDCSNRYLDFLVGAAGQPLDGVRIVLDCANGAAFEIAPEAFSRLGAEVLTLNDTPDGRNINDGCGALHPQKMAARVKDVGAHFGAAFDGDADRVILADENGQLLDGDHILLLLARLYLQTGRLSTRSIVATVMSNMGLEVALKEGGIGLVRSPVGDREVWRAMVSGGHWLGGEQAGHIILRDEIPVGDGILVAIKIASMVAAGRCLLSEVRRDLVKYPQVLLNVPVSRKPDFTAIPSLRGEIQKTEEELENRGRVLVRYSGTEPLVRIMVEAAPGMDIEGHAVRLAARFQDALGADDGLA